MKILLLGKNGQVGWELQRSLSPLGEVIALDRQTVDVLRGNLSDGGDGNQSDRHHGLPNPRASADELTFEHSEAV
jgi:nucleoside-diphosphate-sugar epimerase